MVIFNFFGETFTDDKFVQSESNFATISFPEVMENTSFNYFYVRNHVKLGVSLRVLYCVVDTGYGLGRSLGDCRPALLKG